MKRANPIIPWAFVTCYESLIGVAQDHGYALALHGSITRDLDLIAIPWTANATSREVLMEAMNKEASRWRLNEFRKTYQDHDLKKPSRKPHGRVAYSLHLGSHAYIDISVMPRRAPRKKR